MVSAASIPALVDELPRFKVRLTKNDELVEEGTGKNSLYSPALCVGELAAGETWSAEVDGIALAPLALAITG